jgi:hypothetical protein
VTLTSAQSSGFSRTWSVCDVPATAGACDGGAADGASTIGAGDAAATDGAATAGAADGEAAGAAVATEHAPIAMFAASANPGTPLRAMTVKPPPRRRDGSPVTQHPLDRKDCRTSVIARREDETVAPIRVRTRATWHGERPERTRGMVGARGVGATLSNCRCASTRGSPSRGVPSGRPDEATCDGYTVRVWRRPATAYDSVGAGDGAAVGCPALMGSGDATMTVRSAATRPIRRTGCLPGAVREWARRKHRYLERYTDTFESGMKKKSRNAPTSTSSLGRAVRRAGDRRNLRRVAAHRVAHELHRPHLRPEPH